MASTSNEPTPTSTTLKPTAASHPKTPPYKRPRISSRKQTFATVVVGSEKAEFVIHEALLTHYSEFFRAALQGGFQEAETKIVALPDGDPNTVELFVHWLYHQRFPDAKQGDDEELVNLYENPERLSDQERMKRHRSKSHVLAQLYRISSLQRASLVALFEHLHSDKWYLPGWAFYNYVFSHLTRTDPLCRLAVDYTCHRVRNNYDETNVNTVFLLEVAKRWIRLVHGKPKIDLYNYTLKLEDYLENKEDRTEELGTATIAKTAA